MIGLTPTKASNVVEGDMIDLEHVPAPYVSDEDRENVYAFEYAVVCDRPYYETPECIVIHFNDTSIAFPPDYELMKVMTP